MKTAGQQSRACGLIVGCVPFKTLKTLCQKMFSIVLVMDFQVPFGLIC